MPFIYLFFSLLLHNNLQATFASFTQNMQQASAIECNRKNNSFYSISSNKDTSERVFFTHNDEIIILRSSNLKKSPVLTTIIDHQKKISRTTPTSVSILTKDDWEKIVNIDKYFKFKKEILNNATITHYLFHKIRGALRTYRFDTETKIIESAAASNLKRLYGAGSDFDTYLPDTILLTDRVRYMALDKNLIKAFKPLHDMYEYSIDSDTIIEVHPEDLNCIKKIPFIANNIAGGIHFRGDIAMTSPLIGYLTQKNNALTTLKYLLIMEKYEFNVSLQEFGPLMFHVSNVFWDQALDYWHNPYSFVSSKKAAKDPQLQTIHNFFLSQNTLEKLIDIHSLSGHDDKGNHDLNTWEKFSKKPFINYFRDTHSGN